MYELYTNEAQHYDCSQVTLIISQRRMLKSGIYLIVTEQLALLAYVLDAGEMRRCKDLSHLDITARQLGWSMVETGLAGSSHSAVVMINQHWSKTGVQVGTNNKLLVMRGMCYNKKN